MGSIGSEWFAGPGRASSARGEPDLVHLFARVEGVELDQLPFTDSPDVLEQSLAWFRLLAHHDFARADPVRRGLVMIDLTLIQSLAADQLRSQLRRNSDGRAVILQDDLASIEASFST